MFNSTQKSFIWLFQIELNDIKWRNTERDLLNYTTQDWTLVLELDTGKKPDYRGKKEIMSAHLSPIPKRYSEHRIAIPDSYVVSHSPIIFQPYNDAQQ